MVVSQTYTVKCWLDCEWAFRKGYTDEEILHIIYVNMDDDTYGEILDEISELAGREIDHMEFNEEQFVKYGVNHIIRFEPANDCDEESVAINVSFCLVLDAYVPKGE